MALRLNSKIALITGAASGMGYAMTKLFIEEGAKVVAVDINKNDLEKWDNVENVVPFIADITKVEDIDRMVSEAENRFGKLDIVCNVAGINDLCYTLEDTTIEKWDRVLNIDLKAPFMICQRAVKGMIERGSGVILNIGSYAGLRGNHGPSYTAAKHGIIGLTQSMSVALFKKGIRCNVINPSGTMTNLAINPGGNYHEGGMKLLNDCIGKYPVPLIVEVEDIARAALFLCSDEAKNINGAIVSVDAGMSAC